MFCVFVVPLHFSDDVCAHVFHENQFRFGATKSESVCWCDACVCLIARVHVCVCVCFSFGGPGPSLLHSGDGSALRSLIGQVQRCHSPSPHTMRGSGNRTESMIKVLDTLYMMLVRLTIQWWNKQTQSIEKRTAKKE